VNNPGLLVDDKFEPINLVSGITPMVSAREKKCDASFDTLQFFNSLSSIFAEVYSSFM